MIVLLILSGGKSRYIIDSGGIPIGLSRQPSSGPQDIGRKVHPRSSVEEASPQWLEEYQTPHRKSTLARGDICGGNERRSDGYQVNQVKFQKKYHRWHLVVVLID